MYNHKVFYLHLNLCSQVKLICSAASSPEKLFVLPASSTFGEEVKFMFSRAVSRLIEMQSTEYLQIAHQSGETVLWFQKNYSFLLFNYWSKSVFAHNNIFTGSSIYSLKAFSHSAPTAPSTTRWSQLRVTVKIFATENGFLGSAGFSSTTTLFSVPPTARMHAYLFMKLQV